MPQSGTEDYTLWFVGLVGQVPSDGMLWKAGAKTKWNGVRPRWKSGEFK